MKNKYCTCALFAHFVAFIAIDYSIPVMSNHLNVIKFTPEFFSVFLAINAFWCAAQVYFMDKLLKVWNRRSVIYLGAFILILGMVLFNVDHFNKNGTYKAWVMIGGVCQGFGVSMYVTPLLPEIMDSIQESLKTQEIEYDEEDLFNSVSGYFIMFMALGQVLGPLLSSQINHEFNSVVTVWMVVAVCSIYLLIYVAVCGR